MSVTPITSPPVLIDSQAISFGATFNCFCGPWPDAGNLYCGLVDINTGELEVLKSTDSGATWARQDDGSGATPVTAGLVPIFVAGSIIWLCIDLDSGGSFSANFIDAQAFSFGTDLFGALVADATAFALGSGRTFGALRSDGSILMLYPLQSGIAGISEAWASEFSAGSFAAAFLIDSLVAENIFPIGCVVDSSDVSHVVTNDVSPSLGTRYLTIDGSNSVSAAVSIPTTLPNSGVLDQPVQAGGALAFSYIDGSGPHTRAKMLYATGASSNPATASWSQIDVWTAGLGATSNDSSPFAAFDGADLLVFWINTTAAGIARVYYAKFNGASFDAPVLFYDSSLYPPAGSTMDPTMRGVSLGSTFTGIVSMNIDGSGFQTFYLSGGAVVQSGYRNRVY